MPCVKKCVLFLLFLEHHKALIVEERDNYEMYKMWK